MRRFSEYCGALLLAALLLMGCDGITPLLPPATSPPTGHTSSRATAESAPVTSAADGDNVVACAEGNCEVQVGLVAIMLIPQLTNPPLTIDTVLVQQIQNGVVSLGVGPVSLHQFRFACSGGTPPCEVTQPTGIANAGGAFGGAGAMVTANELTIRIEAVTANTTILKLSTS